MRMIDADRFLRILEINFGHIGGADVMRQLIEAQPTLTPPNEWVSVEERLPESQTPVLAVLQSKTFSKYITISVLAHIGYHEVNTEDDFGWREYEGETEYDEKKDCFWVHPCWYEVNAVDDNPNWEVDDVYEVTHWMPLPAPPDRRPPEGEEALKDADD